MKRAKKPRGIRHDRDCHRCKAHKVKCDLNRPRCQACLQVGEACNYPQRVVWVQDKKQKVSGSSLGLNTASAQNQISRIFTNAEHTGDTTKPTTVNLYGFIDFLGTFYQQIQSSTRDIPKEGVELISRTLSFARSRIQDTNNKESIQSHLVALTNLSQVIKSAHPVALFGIATFAMFEVCCGSFGNWHCHLQGARSLLDLHCRRKGDLDDLCSEITGLADILAYLVWFDVTGALVSESPLIFEDWHRQTLSDTFFESVGCPAETFDLFVYLGKHRETADVNIMELSARAMDQILRIGPGKTDRNLAATVYKAAAAIMAFTRAAALGGDHPTSIYQTNVISTMVDRVCEAIAGIPSTSRFYVHLATPVYITGMHASTARQCDVIRGYWRTCQLYDFPRYPDAEAQCEQRWTSCGVRG
ncbi:hypothetical protein N7535_007588 [Penicillium sp. DV-2018c]|nr:hypothetical protein N7535_007588 [Penicillium sp. DV-2018c]